MAYAQAYNWKNVAINGGGFVPGLVYSPVQQGLLYARTDVGGFYRRNNPTNDWVPLTDMFGRSQGNYFGGESIAPDPVNASIVYAAAGFSGTGAILISTNQGDSWTVNSVPISMAGNNDGRNAGERLAVDPHLNSKLYFGSRWQGLWVSTNSAATWSQVGSFPVNGETGYGLSWVIFDPHGTNGSASATVYVGVLSLSSGNSNVYRSTNGGANWAVISGGPSSMMTPRASLGSDGNLWIVYGSGGYGPSGISSGQIWKLNTSTLAWSNVTPSGGPCNGCGGYGGVSVDAQNAQHAIISTLDWWWPGDQILSTVNGGSSWVTIAMGGYSNSVFDVNGANYQKGCNNGSGGAGWAACVAVDPFNSNNAVYPSGGAGGGGGVWTSGNIQSSPVSWVYADRNFEETVPIYLCPTAAGGILFSGLGDVGGMRHTDVTQSPASGMYCNPQFSNTNCLDYAQSNPQIVVRVGNSGTTTSDVAYSTNNGQNWSPWGSAPPGYGTSNQMGSVAVAADGSRVVVSPYGGNGSPAYATSLGGSWTACSGLPSGAYVASDRSSPSTFYAVAPSNWVYGNSVTVYRSTNYGASFTQVNAIPVQWGDANGNGQWVIPRPVFGQPGEFWVSTYNALYRFTNAGANVVTLSNVYEPMGPVGFGKAASGYTHPAVYLVGTVNGTFGFWRNDDGTGATWISIMDANHQYGGGSGWMEGDENIFGRCYMSAGGRGIVYGDVGATTPTFTFTPTRTLTLTRTFTPFPTFSATATRTNTLPASTYTFTHSATASPSRTASGTHTSTSTPTRTNTLTATATRTNTLPPNTNTFTQTFTHTNTATPTVTRTPTLTRTNTPPPNTSTYTRTSTTTRTSTNTPTWTHTPTQTNTSTFTRTHTAPPNTNTFTSTRTPTSTRTNTPPLNTPSFTYTGTPTFTLTRTASATASPSHSATASRTPTVSSTPTGTASSSMTSTPSLTVTGTNTWTRTATRTTTVTSTQSPSSTPSNTWTPPLVTYTPSFTGSPTRTSTWTRTNTPTFTHTYTLTRTSTPTFTLTCTPTFSATDSPSHSATASRTPSASITPTGTASVTNTRTFTQTRTTSPTVTGTPTTTWTPPIVPYTNTFTGTPTLTSTVTNTNTRTDTLTPTNTWTHTPMFTETNTAALTVTHTPSATASPSGTASGTNTRTFTNTRTVTFTRTETLTPTHTRTSTHTRTETFTRTETVTRTPTHTQTDSLTPTDTFTRTFSRTHTPMFTVTNTYTLTFTHTRTHTLTMTPTYSWTFTPSPTPTPSLTRTWTPLSTNTPTPTATNTPLNLPCGLLTVSNPYPNPVNTAYRMLKVDLLTSCGTTTTWGVYTVASKKVYGETIQVNGPRTVTWNLLDSRGIRVANGLYHVQFEANGRKEIRDIIVTP